MMRLNTSIRYFYQIIDKKYHENSKVFKQKLIDNYELKKSNFYEIYLRSFIAVDVDTLLDIYYHNIDLLEASAAEVLNSSLGSYKHVDSFASDQVEELLVGICPSSDCKHQDFAVVDSLTDSSSIYCPFFEAGKVDILNSIPDIVHVFHVEEDFELAEVELQLHQSY